MSSKEGYILSEKQCSYYRNSVLQLMFNFVILSRQLSKSPVPLRTMVIYDTIYFETRNICEIASRRHNDYNEEFEITNTQLPHRKYIHFGNWRQPRILQMQFILGYNII